MFNIIFIIINCILFLLNIYLFLKYKNYKIEEANKIDQTIKILKKEQNQLIQQNKELKEEIFYKKEEINKNFQKQKEEKNKQLEEYIQNKKQLINKNFQQQEKLASDSIKEINEDLNIHKILAQKEIDNLQIQIDNLKSSLNAGIELKLKEQQKKEKQNFYKLSINKTDLADVEKLQQIKPTLNKPVILSKLIWTQYFQKQMNELCERVLGKTTICGIYKITNILTEQCYVGQSVNVAQRFKQHCKCGLGIDASATNKLYNAMQSDGVWNFTFELIEECPRNLLNEKEKFWIQMYQSNNFGYNSTKGNS